MYLELLIAGLTGCFFWLFTRHLTVFQEEKVRQRAGRLLQEVRLSRKGSIFRAATFLIFPAMICMQFILWNYMLFFFKMELGGTPEWSLGSIVPDAYVLLDLQCFFLGLSLMPFFSFPVRREKTPIGNFLKISFYIHENGIIYNYNQIGKLGLTRWEKIQYCLWLPAKKKLSIQKRGHLPFFRKRLYIDDHETVLAILGQFVEIRDQEQKVLFQPTPPRDKSQASQPSEISLWRRFRFQFDLLSLMLLMLVVASAASWYGYRQHRSEPTKRALAALAEFQPSVAYRDVDVKYLMFWSSARKPDDKDLVGLRSFPSLEALGLSEALITDAALAEIGLLSQLKMLDLMKTPITDVGMIHLRKLSQLRELNLMATGISDAGLASLTSSTGLKILYLSGTKVTDAGLIHLQAFPQLETLFLSVPGITDKGLQHLAVLKNLRKLHLAGSRITDAGLACLKPLTRLEKLDLNGTRISDVALPSLYGLKNLKSLDIDATQITPGGAKSLRQSLPNTDVFYKPPTSPSQSDGSINGPN